MAVVDYLARPLLASVFVASGMDYLLRPAAHAEAAKPVVERLNASVPAVPGDPRVAVRAHGAIQVACGLALATGHLPRMSALVLATTLVPATLADHRFWECKDAAERRRHRNQFLNNAALFGGLLTAATNRRGSPSLGWRARHAVRGASLPLP